MHNKKSCSKKWWNHSLLLQTWLDRALDNQTKGPVFNRGLVQLMSRDSSQSRIFCDSVKASRNRHVSNSVCLLRRRLRSQGR